MHWKNRLRAGGDRAFDQLFVNVQRVRADVDEHGPCLEPRYGAGSRNKRIGGQDHFVARTQIAKHRRDLQGRGT